MIEKISVRIFITCMLLCAAWVLAMVWLEPDSDEIFKVAPTLFIVGFASFLIWATTMVYKYYEKLG